jgi:putative toxin-antitoxin system antitoxin component (TIGR02293 family)
MKNRILELPQQETSSNEGFPESHPVKGADLAPLSAKWEQAQAETLGGKVVQLHPRELGFWAGRFSSDELDELVIPKRTLARRKARHESLTVDETDKALRLARISSEADRVFSDPEKSFRWLRKPNAALAGNRPLDLLKSETGSRAVDEVLGQIDHGMFS